MAGFIKKRFNVSKWAAVDQTKEDTKIIGKLFKGVFVKPDTETLPYDETFEDAMERLGLTEDDIVNSQKKYFRISLLFLAFGILILGYALFLFIYGHIIAWLFCLLLATLVFVNFYRFHFWYIQIKYRTLGLSFKQWLALALNVKGK